MRGVYGIWGSPIIGASQDAPEAPVPPPLQMLLMILLLQTTYMMELKVESTSIAHRFTFVISSPQGGGIGVAVGTRQSRSSIDVLG